VNDQLRPLEQAESREPPDAGCVVKSTSVGLGHLSTNALE
jgi:hypothetical protein